MTMPVGDPTHDYRERMVSDQIEGRGISDPRVLSILRVVPRHRFVRDKDQEMAYADKPVEIGYGATISQPYIVASMTELLKLKGTERILEIGTGSGYQTAILAELAGEVFTVEIVPQLGERAARILKEMGYSNIHFLIGEGSQGWKEEAPFDAILVTAAPEGVPKDLIDQLAEGGRLVVPIGKSKQHLYIFTKSGGRVREEKKFEVRFVPLIERADGH